MRLLLKVFLFTLVVPAGVGGYLPLLLVRELAPAPGPARLVAVLLFAAGSAVYLWCVYDFAVFGRGTPAPIDPPRRLVVRGLYRYTRNPMYLGMLTVILAWLVLFATPALLAYLLAFGGGFHLVVVFYEEPRLRQLFGADYDRYRQRVPRWIPRVPTGSRAPDPRPPGPP